MGRRIGSYPRRLLSRIELYRSTLGIVGLPALTYSLDRSGTARWLLSRSFVASYPSRTVGTTCWLYPDRPSVLASGRCLTHNRRQPWYFKSWSIVLEVANQLGDLLSSTRMRIAVLALLGCLVKCRQSGISSPDTLVRCAW